MRWHRLVVPASLVAAALTAQVPPGYHLGAPVAIPDSLVEVIAGGRFRATVLRLARNARERALIETAERLYPDAQTLLGPVADSARRAWLASTGTGAIPGPHRHTPRAPGNPSDRWWGSHFDATWLSFAVTAAAVDYYVNRLRDIAAGRGQFMYGPNEPPDNGEFQYQASVRDGGEPGVAHVVELRIRWHYWCGPLCAMTFVHARTVSFDAKGAVVRIIGDGDPPVIVS